MEKHIVRTNSITRVTHDVLRIQTEKPTGFDFVPGQATEVAINKSGWEHERRPFTFTSLPPDNFLEFTIKIYPERKGVTDSLSDLKTNDELILHDVFGAISYQGEGIFIAGGAGVTPFISIFRDLYSKNAVGNNKLIFANKTKRDIILEEEFRQMLNKNFINILSDEKAEGYAHGYISEEFLKTSIDGANKYYLCGPPPMMNAILPQLSHLKVPDSSIVMEEF